MLILVRPLATISFQYDFSVCTQPAPKAVICDSQLLAETDYPRITRHWCRYRKRLAAEGADIAFSYARSPERVKAVASEIEALGVKVLAVAEDQADSDAVASFVRKAHEHFGRLDILVNNAGVFVTGVIGDPQVDIAELDRQHAVNIGSVVAAVRAAGPLLADGGRIVSIGTMFASRAPFPGIGDYAASKAAVAAYGRARDLGQRHITVNSIQPGPINTELNPETSDMAPMVKQMTALGRYGQPEEVAGAVAF